MAQLVIDLRVHDRRLHYNVIAQDACIGPIISLPHRITYRVGNRIYCLGDAAYRELFYYNNGNVNVWLGGAQLLNRGVSIPHTIQRLHHSDALDQQRKVLAVLLRFARDHSIQLSQHHTP